MATDLASEDTTLPEEVTLRAENISGIDSTTVTLRRGVTVLTGRNATNRTSLLRAVMAALGSDDTTLKADADEGYAELDIGGETYRRTLHRENGTVVTDGDPYLEDAELADLFAFLLESNEARQAVTRGDDLRELIMRPVDTAAIESRIEQYERRKRELDDELGDLDDLAKRLPTLEQKRTRLSSEMEELSAELEEAEAALEETSDNLEERREEKAALEEKLTELRSVRSDLERTRTQIETERESIDALETERDDLDDRLETLSVAEDDEIDRLEAEIATLEEQTATLDDEISQLQRTIQFNEQLLEESLGFSGTGGEADGHTADGGLTDQLLSDAETVTCWTCGSSVGTEQIEQTIDQLQAARSDKLETRNELRSTRNAKRQTLSKHEADRSEYERASRRRESIDDEIDQRTAQLDSLQSTREELVDRVSEVEDEIQQLESESYSEVLDQHKAANQLEFKLEQKANERQDVDDEIETIEERLAEREEIEERREDVTDTLTDLRTRIEQIEANAVSVFNEHMENVLEILQYDNLDRVWIKRRTRDVREGRRTVTKSTFELTIVRSTADDSAYEDSVDHLSESEREVTGLVFALAGHLVHEVYRTVPFMLLDSLEAIDANRIANLVEYFETYAPYLVVALLVEDAQSIETDHHTVSKI